MMTFRMIFVNRLKSGAYWSDRNYLFSRYANDLSDVIYQLKSYWSKIQNFYNYGLKSCDDCLFICTASVDYLTASTAHTGWFTFTHSSSFDLSSITFNIKQQKGKHCALPKSLLPRHTPMLTAVGKYLSGIGRMKEGYYSLSSVDCQLIWFLSKRNGETVLSGWQI